MAILRLYISTFTLLVYKVCLWSAFCTWLWVYL